MSPADRRVDVVLEKIGAQFTAVTSGEMSSDTKFILHLLLEQIIEMLDERLTKFSKKAVKRK